jgi:hypothetical protein
MLTASGSEPARRFLVSRVHSLPPPDKLAIHAALNVDAAGEFGMTWIVQMLSDHGQLQGWHG